MAKKSAPDPRFDPRFQRGYDGPEPDAPATPAVPSPLETARSSPGPAARGAAEIAPAPDAGRPSAPKDEADDDALWAPPRRNPFAIALLVGGIALIAVGLWLIWSIVTQSSYPDGNDRAAQAFGLIQQQVTPALLIAGLFGIVAWLVLGALAAAARRDE
jgi:hypothetical protein